MKQKIKQFTIYYKGFKKIKAYTRKEAFNEALKTKVNELYVQPRRTLIFDCFLDNLPFFINLLVWLALMFSMINLIGLAEKFEHSGLKIIYLMSLLFLVIKLPRIGRSVGKIYRDMFSFLGER